MSCDSSASSGRPCREIVLGPGPGWGTGAHETTQLCLQAIALYGPVQASRGFRMLDFGSGSGILSIAGALLGASVEAVEIDEGAIRSARENARMSGVEKRIRFSSRTEGAAGPCDLVVANILRPVLYEFAPELVGRLAPGGTLVLSGLVATDVPELAVHYGGLLKGRGEPEVYRRGEWRALVWRAPTA